MGGGHIADGEYVATMWDADTSFVVITIFECFRVAGGESKEAKAFLDPRPITDAVNSARSMLRRRRDNGMCPTRETADLKSLQSCGRAGDAGQQALD